MSCVSVLCPSVTFEMLPKCRKSTVVLLGKRSNYRLSKGHWSIWRIRTRKSQCVSDGKANEWILGFFRNNSEVRVFRNKDEVQVFQRFRDNNLNRTHSSQNRWVCLLLVRLECASRTSLFIDEQHKDGRENAVSSVTFKNS